MNSKLQIVTNLFSSVVSPKQVSVEFLFLGIDRVDTLVRRLYPWSLRWELVVLD